jgi:hypothetical protein
LTQDSWRKHSELDVQPTFGAEAIENETEH